MQIEPATVFRFGFGVVALLVGILILRVAAGRLRKAWVLFSTSESNAASVSPGETAAVAGTVVSRTDERVSAPFLGAEGVLAGTSIENYDRDEDGSDWDTVYDSVDSVPFAVEDDTGRVTVDAPTGDDYMGDIDFTGGIVIDRERMLSAGGQEPLSGAAEYAQSHDGIGLDITSSGHQYRVRQGVITEGDEVYVLGEATQGDGGVTISGPADPTAFTVSTEGKPGSLTQVFFAVFIGVFGVVASATGIGLLALPYLT